MRTPVKRRTALLAGAILVAVLAFSVGYYVGRPSINELAGLPPSMMPPPDWLLGSWRQEGVESPAHVAFFHDWSFWYHANKPVMIERIMGGFVFDDTTVTLRPRFFTRESIKNNPPESMKVSSDGRLLITEDGAVFVKLD